MAHKAFTIERKPLPACGGRAEVDRPDCEGGVEVDRPECESRGASTGRTVRAGWRESGRSVGGWVGVIARGLLGARSGHSACVSGKFVTIELGRSNGRLESVLCCRSCFFACAFVRLLLTSVSWGVFCTGT